MRKRLASRTAPERERERDEDIAYSEWRKSAPALLAGEKNMLLPDLDSSSE